jgi:chemotaxis family two-component system response regulator PixH
MNSILVIEDDEVARELMRMALARRGYTVVVAEDGIEGYEKAVSMRPDLIVTDIRMPAADGVHLVRRVRDTSELAETPILVTTGFGSGSATFALAQGATAYEPKPINPESFLATVKRLIDKGEG